MEQPNDRKLHNLDTPALAFNNSHRTLPAPAPHQSALRRMCHLYIAGLPPHCLVKLQFRDYLKHRFRSSQLLRNLHRIKASSLASVLAYWCADDSFTCTPSSSCMSPVIVLQGRQNAKQLRSCSSYCHDSSGSPSLMMTGSRGARMLRRNCAKSRSFSKRSWAQGAPWMRGRGFRK